MERLAPAQRMNFVPFGKQLGISELNRALAQNPSQGQAPKTTPPPLPLVAQPVAAQPVTRLAQTQTPPSSTVVVPENEPRPLAGEPNLNSVMASLNNAEATDFRGWGYKERIQFLNGYQYLATMSAMGLRRADGSLFQGAFPQSVDLMTTALQAAAPYFKTLDAQNAKAAEQAATVLQDATKAEPKAQDITRKYLLLRDRVAWELANGDSRNPDPDKRFPPMTIRYEILGTDPANPGVLYSRTVGTTPNDPDLIVEYSTMTPRELWNEGLRLESKYEDLGVSFKKLDMSGANLRLGVGPALILGILITVIIALLAAWWLWNHITTNNKILDIAIQNIQSDPRLSPAEKADKILGIKSTNSFFNVIFGFEFPWQTLIIGATVVGVAFVGLPMLFGYLSGSQEKEKRKLGAAGAMA